MNDCIIPPRDVTNLVQHYMRHYDPEKDLSVEKFLGIIIKKFPKENSFEKYIDGETYYPMKGFGFSGNWEEWGERYGLTEEAYQCYRSVTIEKFVQMFIKRKRSGENFEGKFDLHKSLRE